MSTPSKLKKAARDRLTRLMWELHADDAQVSAELRGKIPDVWHLLSHDDDISEPKEKITLRLDRSVIKFYRALGAGYQSRINRVLATYAAMQIAGLEKAEAALDAELRRLRQEGETR